MGGSVLRDYQQAAVDHALQFLASAQPGDKRLYAAPTGTGKSYIQWELQRLLTSAWIVTPKLEIIKGFLDKAGAPSGLSEEAVIERAWSMGITTPIRLRNAMMRGDGPEIKYLILDEAHHDEAESWQDIHLLAGDPPCVGYTASPFRGSPRSTATFRERWGDPVWILTFSEAAWRGALTMPECSTVPLLDDDVIEARDGEFVVSKVSEATIARLYAAAGLCVPWIDSRRPASPWDISTMFTLPSRESARELGAILGPFARVVDGGTPYCARQEAFTACIARRAALIQIGVVSEGVDLPIRRLVDLSPCLSPVRWLQQFGRITRPGGRSRYVCCNRNLMRHGYLLDGCLPDAAYRQAEDAFGGPSQRAAFRVIGLEAIGRLKPIELKLSNGVTTTAYAITRMENHQRTDYFVIVHPTRSEPIWATKDVYKNPETGALAYGSWRRCAPPSDLVGFASIPPRPLTDKQKAWWQRSAPGFGLADAEPNQKQFQVLPVLCDIRARLV